MKNGHKGGKQLYRCKECDRQFVGGKRLDDKEVEREYVDGKQTLVQLAAKHGVCVKTIWNSLGGMRHKRVISRHKEVIIQLDATYWGRYFGIVAIKDAMRNRVLWYKFIKSHETTADYTEGLNWLKEQGFRVYGAVCDGFPGLLRLLKERKIPAQMCQFHMISIVRTYLTNKPDIEAACSLLALAKGLSQSDEATFTKDLKEWHQRWKDVLNEKRSDPSGTNHFVRPRLRAAYHSLRRHLPWLWTYERLPALHLPRTNSGIESFNSKLKTALRVHSGLSSERRKKFIENYIATHY